MTFKHVRESDKFRLHQAVLPALSFMRTLPSTFIPSIKSPLTDAMQHGIVLATSVPGKNGPSIKDTYDIIGPLSLLLSWEFPDKPPIGLPVFVSKPNYFSNEQIACLAWCEVIRIAGASLPHYSLEHWRRQLNNHIPESLKYMLFKQKNLSQASLGKTLGETRALLSHLPKSVEDIAAREPAHIERVLKHD